MKDARIIFPLFLLVALVTYFPTLGAGFVYDFPGWQKEYEAGTFADILNCFGYKGNHQLLHLIVYPFYRLFHISGWPWYVLFTSLHAFNAWLLYTWLRRTPALASAAGIPWLAGLAALFFLLHPYGVETVVWKVCLHYLLSLGAILGMLILHETYMATGSRRHLSYTLGLYGASLFLLELSFVTPFLVGLWLAVQATGRQMTRSWLARGLILCASMLGLLGAYLILNRLTLGAWIGHYGASAHLAFDFLGILSTELKYLVKHLFAARYYSFATKGWLFDHLLARPEFVFFMLVVVLSGLIWFVLKSRTVTSGVRLAWFGLLGSMLVVLPVSNLYFLHLHVGMNDRYSYVPVALLCAMLVGLLARLPKAMSIAVMSLLIVSHTWLQQLTIDYWKKSTEVLQALKDDFRWHDRSPVFVLNSPDNYKGIVMTSIVNEPSGVHELIDYQTAKPFPGEMFDIFQINMNGMPEGVSVEQTGPLQIKVRPNQWGNWWHRNGIGASSYENEYYKAELLDYPYLLTFKQLPPGSAIIYQDSMRWKEFVMQHVDEAQ